MALKYVSIGKQRTVIPETESQQGESYLTAWENSRASCRRETKEPAATSLG